MPTESIYAEQKDWNQTLMTTLNSISVDSKSLLDIKVPQELAPLIESLEFYNPHSKNIGNKFICEFIESDKDVIHVGEFDLEIENYKAI